MREFVANKMADGTFCSFVGFSLFVAVFILSLLVDSSQQDILGCGGFLKSPASIDFSKVEVKLFTKQGTLKESSDCAPTNGYYFIPLYDKGEYLLRIQPPPDWLFEPNEVHLNFDGVNDPCSKAKDINFVFQGFTISGKVTSAGSTEGPENVIVKLRSENDKSLAMTSMTVPGGSFTFSPILPGNLIINAEHERYNFQKNSVKFTVKENALEVPLGSLVIAGYDITGKVLFNNEPTVGVSFLLEANDARNRNAFIPGCTMSTSPGPKQKDHICRVESDEEGIFRYQSVPPGSYTIRPQYVKFDVHPEDVNVVVKHEHVVLAENFVVKGFSVSGRVLTSARGPGIEKAVIRLNNEVVAVTDHEGRYTLGSMEPGSYRLSVRSEKVKFQDIMVKLSPNALEIDNIYPTEFQVCGRVTSVTSPRERIVEIEQSGKTTEVTTDRNTGRFCHFLRPGKYNMGVKVTDLEKSTGMQYLPLVREVHVKNSPVNDIEFTQLRGNIRGKVVKLPEATKAGDLSVKLKMKNSLVALKILEGNDLAYGFHEIMPGFYDVEIENNVWCFQNQVHSISVTSSETTVPDFIQKGFKVAIKSSHETSALVTGDAPGEEGFRQEFLLQRGVNSICLPRLTSYKLVPRGCHGFEKDFYRIEPRERNMLHLNAVAHDVVGIIRTAHLETGLVVDVTLPEGETKRLGPLKGEKDGSGFVYRFKYRTREQQNLKFVPVSEKLIFFPESLEYRTTNDCSNDAVQFTGERGLIVQGSVEPPLSNVKVTFKATDAQSDPEELVFFTEADGKYKFGPLKRTTTYHITAEKESYVMSGPDAKGTFKAHKLAEISVKVIDNATKEPLQGVLLSLTGGEKYRKNSKTTEGGLLSFHSLSPGEYFLRPMMKEYKFEPSSQIIQIREGVTETIELRGRRVSFSAYGSVASLNGEPEANVVIEATGTNTCPNMQEEATSELNGQFRIRGLLPQCEYQIRLKNGPDVNSHVYRLEPSDIVVQTNKGDVRDIELIAFHQVQLMDVTVHVESAVPEHLKSLRLKVCKDSEPDSPVYSVKLDTLAGGAKHWGNAASQERFLKAGLLVPIPFIPRDKTSYFIQLESSLNRHTYKFKEPSVHFVADKTFRSFRMTFDASMKTFDQELSQKNYMLVPVLIVAGLLYTYFGKAGPVIQNLIGSLNQASFAFTREERGFYPQHGNVMDNVSIEPVLVSTKRKTKPRKT